MYTSPLDALSLGIFHGDLKQVSQTLEQNPYLLYYTDANGTSPLHWAAKEGQCAIVEYLVNNGAFVNLTSLKLYHTPLHYAAASGHAGCVQTLINLNANIDAADKEGKTAAHWACIGAHTKCLLVLKECGADTKKQDLSGRTPMDIAQERFLRECIDILAREQTTPQTDHATYSKVNEQVVIKSLGIGSAGKLSRIFNFQAQTVAYLVEDRYAGKENSFSAFRNNPDEILAAYNWLQEHDGKAKHPFRKLPRRISKN